MKKLLLLTNCISLIITISTCHSQSPDDNEKKDAVVTYVDTAKHDVPVVVYDSSGNIIDTVILTKHVIEQTDPISKPKRIEHKSDQQSKLDSIKDAKAKEKKKRN